MGGAGGRAGWAGWEVGGGGLGGGRMEYALATRVCSLSPWTGSACSIMTRHRPHGIDRRHDGPVIDRRHDGPDRHRIRSDPICLLKFCLTLDP